MRAIMAPPARPAQAWSAWWYSCATAWPLPREIIARLTGTVTTKATTSERASDVQHARSSRRPLARGRGVNRARSLVLPSPRLLEGIRRREASPTRVRQHPAQELPGPLLRRRGEDPSRRALLEHRPSSRKHTLVATSRANPISWVAPPLVVASTIVVPPPARSRRMSSTSPTSSGSSAEVDLVEQQQRRARWPAPAPSAARCCCPPESRSGCSSALSASPNRASSSRARASASAARHPVHLARRERDVVQHASCAGTGCRPGRPSPSGGVRRARRRAGR